MPTINGTTAAAPDVNDAGRFCGNGRGLEGSVMCAPIGGRCGPVGAHPQDGALLERWRAQCGCMETTIADPAASRICGSPACRV